jgi:signal transduction histidine kinase
MSDLDSSSILAVDDDPVNLQLLVDILTEQGYAVRPTTDARFAITSAQIEPPDLILLDIIMPRMTGYEACQALRADERTRDIPVIFLSALAEVQDKLRAFDVGGVDYITKPFQVAEVLSRVENHLAFKRLRDSLQEKNVELVQENTERRRSAELLRQQKELLESTIDSLTHPFYVISARDYTIEIANAAAESLIRGAEMMTCYALSHQRDEPCDGDEYPCPLQRVVETGEPVTLEHMHRDANGAERHVEVHGYPIFEPDGRIARIIEYSLDITERKRLEEAAKEAVAAAERERLSRDLHDAVTQTLFSASLIAEVLPQLWEKDAVEAQRNLAKLRQLTRGAMAEMRTLLLELRPAALAERPLGDLLRHLAEALTNRTKIPVRVTVDQECAAPPGVRIAHYRIAQEALNNIARHSGASHADLSLRCSAERIQMRICDDGCGFDRTAIPPGHMGVGIMRERAEGIGAAFEIESELGQGTRVSVTWSRDEHERISR